MFLPIPSKPLTGLEALKAFEQELDILGASEDTDKVIGIMEKLLREISLNPKPSSEISLVGRVEVVEGVFPGQTPSERALVKVQEMLTNPGLRAGADPLVVKAVQMGMKKRLESKLECLKFGKILPGVSSLSIEALVSGVKGFYHQGLPLSEALARGMARSVIGLDIDKDKELEKDLEADLELKGSYTCAIEKSLVGSDAVYLEKDGERLTGRYHENAIKTWLQSKSIGPLAREEVTVANIKPDYEAMEFIKEKILAWVDSKMGSVPTYSADVKELQSKNILFAIAVAYPIVKKKYEESLEESQSVVSTIENTETFAKEAMNRFISLLDGVNMEEVVLSCFPYIADLMRLSAAKLRTSEDLSEVRTAFQKKLKDFVLFFHEIDKNPLPIFFAEKLFKMKEEGVSLSRIKEIIKEYEVPLREEAELKKEFPDFLIGGNEDWAKLSEEVEYVPIPKGMKDLAKRLGKTHVFALVPDKVAGETLTLESFGALFKAKGHFPGSIGGYQYLSPDVIETHIDIRKKNSVTEPKWVVMTRDVLLGSKNEAYDKQKIRVLDLAKETNLPYKLPDALDAVVCIYMNYLATGNILYGPRTYTRGLELIDGKYPVLIGDFAPSGLEVIYDIGGGDFDNVGASALCEVPAIGL